MFNMKLEVYIPEELLTLMSEAELKSKIEDFIRLLSFEQKLKLVSSQLKSAFPNEEDYWKEIENSREEAWSIYKNHFWF